MKHTLSRILDIIGKILAIVLVVAFLLHFLNINFDFLPVGVASALSCIYVYGAFVLVAIVAVEATIKHSLILTVIMLVLIAVVAIFMFFPDARDSIINWLPVKK